MSRKALADMFAKTLMEKVVKGAVDYMVDLFTGDKDGDRGFAKIKKDAGSLWDTIAGLWSKEKIMKLLSGAGGIITGIFSGAFGAIKTAAGGLWAGFGWTKEVIYSALQQAISWFIGLFDGSATSAFAMILSAAGTLWRGISSIFSQKTFSINYSYNQVGNTPATELNMPNTTDTGTHIPGPEPGSITMKFLDWIGLGPKYEGPELPKGPGEQIWGYLWARGRGGDKDDIWKLYKQFKEFRNMWWQGTGRLSLPSSFPLMSYKDQLTEWLKEEKGIDVYKHTGGLLRNEGLFIGLEGEGVLNRSAMGMLGEGGLQRLNQGKSAGWRITSSGRTTAMNVIKGVDQRLKRLEAVTNGRTG